MELDAQASAAVELLVSDPKCVEWLRTRTKKLSIDNLKKLLYEKSDADPSDYNDILETAFGRVSGQRPPDRPPPSRRRGTVDSADVRAPFRFIDIPELVVLPEPEALGPIDVPKPNGFCGSIEVEWIAETPFLVGGAGGEAAASPVMVGGKPVVPGSTLRGLVRSAMEILAFGKLTQANLHHRFGVRDFVHEHYSHPATGITAQGRVKAGFLKIRDAVDGDDPRSVTRDGKVWTIKPALEWNHVEIDSLGALGVAANLVTPKQRQDKNKKPMFDDKTGQPVMYFPWAELKLEEKYRKVNGFAGPSQKKLRGFDKAGTDPHGRTIYRATAGAGQKSGVFVASGKLPGGGNKRFEYFVVRDAKAVRAAMSAAKAELFERMYSKPAKGERLEPDGSWALLRDQAHGEGIPVFFVGNHDGGKPGHGDFSFGMTRLFKLPHRFSVGEVLKRTRPAHVARGRLVEENGAQTLRYKNVDFVENLFGYVVEPGDLEIEQRPASVEPSGVARKGRVAFGIAFTDSAYKAENTSARVIQMAPRASFAPFYLAGTLKDWSSPASRLAGRKAYGPNYAQPDFAGALGDFRAFGQRQIDEARANGVQNTANIESRLHFLVPVGTNPLVFSGRIEVSNVTAAELGGLLYAITHGGDEKRCFRHMIGRGKAFGAGQFRIGKVSLAVEANDLRELAKAEGSEVHDPATGKGFVPAGGASLKPFLDAFETYMRAHAGETYPMHPTVQEWFGMARPDPGRKVDTYKPLADERKLFDAYKRLKDATQMIRSPDSPLGKDRLLAAPSERPPRAR